MESLLQDLKVSARGLWKDRGFTLTAVATLALCLAANTAIFAIVNTVLLRPLPFDAPEQLIAFSNNYPGAGLERGGSNGVPDYFDRLRDVPALEKLTTYRTTGVTIGGDAGRDPARVLSMPVTPSFFEVLRVGPLRGRVFTSEDAEPGQERKVVLSYGTWQRLFGGRDDGVGRDLRINGQPHSIVGVMPEEFRFVDPEVELWTPAAFTAADRADDRRHSNSWQQVGRLRAGASLDQAQAQVDALNARNLDLVPALREALVNVRFHTRAARLQDELVYDVKPTMYLLWVGALLMLIIGCVNVMNLVSVRATTRMREMATRAALGGGVVRLSRQLLTETMLLAATGGVAGVLLAWWALQAVSMLGFGELPRGNEIALDGTTLIVGFVVVLAVGALAGVMPLLSLARTNLATVVREEGRSGTATRGTRILRRALVTSQVALALLLLVGAGLLLASFERVLAIRPGFVPEQVMTGTISLPAARYADEAALRSTTDRLLTALRTLPGVEAVGVTTTIPFGGSYSDGVILAEGYQMQPGESVVSPNNVTVSDGYFEAMRTKLVEGRFFDQRDGPGAPRTIIVDEKLAQRFWPSSSPIGRRMFRPDNAQDMLIPPKDEAMFTVVGVVEHMRLTGLVDPAGLRGVGAYYLPARQFAPRTMTLAIRTVQEPATVVSAARQQLAAIDRELPFYAVESMEQRTSEALVERRTPMLLALGFAAVALFLCAIGIYGTLAYQVRQRTREIGIRMALGAGAPSIFRMVLTEGAAIVAFGSALGLTAAFLLRRALEAQLYEVTVLEPRVLGGVAGLLFVVAAIACILPAGRAAQTDPVVALSE